MKINNLHFIFFVVSIMFISCTTAPITERSYNEIVQFNNMKKDRLYAKSLQWMALNFKSSKSVIQYQDKDEGVIIGKFTMDSTNPPCWLDCTVKIETKDEKARLSFVADIITCPAGNNWPVSSGEARSAKQSFSVIKDSYQNFINKTSSKNEEW